MAEIQFKCRHCISRAGIFALCVSYLLQCLLQTRWSLIIELELLLHSGEPGLALLESVLMTDVFLQLPV